MKAWLLWFLLCGLVQAVVALIATATAIHSSHYGPRSVGMAALIVSGIEMAITAFFVSTEWWASIETAKR